MKIRARLAVDPTDPERWSMLGADEATQEGWTTDLEAVLYEDLGFPNMMLLMDIDIEVRLPQIVVGQVHAVELAKVDLVEYEPEDDGGNVPPALPLQFPGGGHDV